VYQSDTPFLENMKRNVYYLLALGLCVLLWCMPRYGYSQALDFKTYTVSDGLPHGQITDMAQTKDGIMWIGTIASGLVRFDGHQYVTYGITKGLKDDMVVKTLADSKNRLWVATYSGGVAVMENDSLVYPFSNHRIDSLYITSILEAPNGDIWFGTFDDSVYLFNGTALTHHHKSDQLIDSTIWDVHWDKDGSIWFATHRGISILNGDSIRHYSTIDGLSADRVYRIIVDDHGLKWMATSRGITTFDGTTFQTITEIDDTPLNYVYDLIKDRSGRIWIGMENTGIYWYYDGKFTHVTRAQGLVSNYVHRFFLDNNGSVWVGSDENGISIYRGEGFLFYRNTPGLNTNEILGFHKDNEGTIWVGTNLGVSKFDHKGFQQVEIDIFGAASHQVWVLSTLPNGNLLILVDNAILVEYDGKKFSNYNERIGLGEHFIVDVHFDSSNNMWIATDEGLLRYDGKSIDSFIQADGLPGSVINHLFEAENGDMWIATNLGVARFDGNTFHSIRLSDGLAHYNVKYITQDKRGDFWFGTSAGVSYYKRNSESGATSITNFGRADGMKLVDTLFLIFDDTEQLWHGTNGGLHRLNVARYVENGLMSIEHYRLSRFGLGIETNHDAVLKVDSNTIWFGTMEGIVELDLAQFRRRPISSPVTHIDQVRFNGVPSNFIFTDYSNPEEEDYVGPRTEFSYGNNSISFHFSGIEYVNPQNLTYRYRLRGFDAQWITVHTNNSVTYTNLPAGAYEFIVQSKVGTDPWSANTATVPILIRSPYWQTAWFWLLIVFLSIVSVTAFIRLRLHFLEKRTLDKLVMEKTATLTRALEEKNVLIKEVHHRVKNNLSIIYGLLELQMEYMNDDRIKDVFRDSQLRVHSIAMVHEKLYQSDNLSRIDARKYIKDLVTMIFESMKDADKSIHLSLDIDEIHLTLDQGVPCGLILNELISNSIKHAFTEAASGIVSVSLKQEGGKTVLSVSDNGKGLPVDYKIGTTESLGHVLIEALTRQLKTSIEIQSNPGDTRFQIRFNAA
jgi:two-component sensor histidine kinase/ligand-binding sensor domain-containing protein